LNERSSYAGLKTSYHDNLWARFRSLSQRILISQAIKAKLDGSQDSFETFYSDFVDEEDLEKLR
jgi:hypothetical protein